MASIPGSTDSDPERTSHLLESTESLHWETERDVQIIDSQLHACFVAQRYPALINKRSAVLTRHENMQKFIFCLFRAMTRLWTEC